MARPRNIPEETTESPEVVQPKFQPKDECVIHVVDGVKCGHGYTECLGKACKKYTPDPNIQTRHDLENELAKLTAQKAHLDKQIAAVEAKLK